MLDYMGSTFLLQPSKTIFYYPKLGHEMLPNKCQCNKVITVFPS